MLTELFDAIERTPAWQSVLAGVASGGVFACIGIPRSAQSFAVALLHRRFPERPILAVTKDTTEQDRLYHDLGTWLGTRTPPNARIDNTGTDTPPKAPPRLMVYPEWGIRASDLRLPTADILSDRLETLMALRFGKESGCRAPIVIATAVALIERTFAPEELGSRSRLIQKGDNLDPLDLVEWLEEQAYEPEAQVTQKGELAMRGGIVDVFPLAADWPVRIEFFGNTVDSIRFFDPATQISREETDRVWVGPGGELGLLRRLVKPAQHCSNADQTAAGSKGNIENQAEETGPCSITVGQATQAKLGTLADYLGPESILVLCEPGELTEAAHKIESESRAHPLVAAWDDLMSRFDSRGITRVEFSEGSVAHDALFDLGMESLESYRPGSDRAPDPLVVETRRREFIEQIHRWLRQQNTVYVFLNNDAEQQQFMELWREGCQPNAAAGVQVDSSGMTSNVEWNRTPRLYLGSIDGGFLSSAARVVVVSDGEVFGRYKVRRPRRLEMRATLVAGTRIETELSDLEEGDYVVHVQYGIGRFLGLERITSWSCTNHSADQVAGEECLVIEYAPRKDGDPPPRLHVPVSQIHLITKYIGVGKGRPPLSKLGGTRWLKAKAEATRAARDLAADLLAVQAARAALPGFAFPPDCAWQRDFENAFPFEETPDQLRAIEETKRDMCMPKPMDRLICGDAGFGKTEVAIRAAFKAVLAGKQVAVLVPTTVLAHQHFNTFSSRMAGYPIRIELLSRFRTKAEQDRVIRDLAIGAVDIVIGTHRLLQPDVKFKDLGLVVIDEEQRFGVVQKERLKRLRQLVDVLTLTATPIPRTLYLALAGVRDMSSIETPPQDRLPVETIVAPYSDQLVREAILRELRRGGQVFYLHNNIYDIDSVALRLRSLVPEARIAVGHGRMSSAQLERTMTRFIAGEIDVLLSTTIVESGIDIPNANTIIIDRADRFGLSDLYQLRGRVGRYKHQAYAYLLIPKHAALLEDARKRIAAIKQFTKPGSGFKIAMRDLEIRGAGNILGPEQSGHIAAVGFELYCQLLKQSIAALKGEPLPQRTEVDLRLDFLDTAPVSSCATIKKRNRPKRRGELDIPPDLGFEVPRDVATWTDRYETVPDLEGGETPEPICRAVATLPLNYVSEPKHRLEIYRKLALATAEVEIEALRKELRDRFGPLPPSCELLLLAATLKPLAAKVGVSSVETRGDRLMLLRGRDYVTVDGQFPRLTRRTAKGLLNEIRKHLLALQEKNEARVEPGEMAKSSDDPETSTADRSNTIQGSL